MSVFVVRAFVRLRQMLASHAELARKLDALEQKYDANPGSCSMPSASSWPRRTSHGARSGFAWRKGGRAIACGRSQGEGDCGDERAGGRESIWEKRESQRGQ